MKRKRPSMAVMSELAELLSGDVLREIADIADHGEISVAEVVKSHGAVNEIHPDKRDVITSASEPMEYGRGHHARLYHPAGIVFRLPQEGESALLMRPKQKDAHFGTGAPGFSLLVPDGGDGQSGYLPDWLGDDDCGVYATDETVHVESKQKDVVINAGGAEIHIYSTGKITIQDKAGGIATFDGQGNITVQAVAPNGVAQVTATPVTGQVKLGPVGTLPVLVQGTFDSLGVPVTQNPVAALTIVKAG